MVIFAFLLHVLPHLIISKIQIPPEIHILIMILLRGKLWIIELERYFSKEYKHMIASTVKPVLLF